MSASGPKRTSPNALHMSAFGSKADMDRCTAYVCAAARIGEAAKRGGLQRKNTRLNATLQTPSR